MHRNSIMVFILVNIPVNGRISPVDHDVTDPIKLEIHHINMKTWDKRPELQVARYPDNILKTATREVGRIHESIQSCHMYSEYSWSGSICDQT
jgi:hypothetical protein